MLTEVTRTDALAVTAVTIYPAAIVPDEQKWFCRPREYGQHDTGRGVSPSRWSGYASEAREEVSAIAPDCHVLAIALRQMNVTAFAAPKVIHDGPLPQGTMLVLQPGLPVRAIFRGGYDALHLRIKNTVIAEFLEAERDPRRNGEMTLTCLQPTVDPVIERLGRALVHADDFGPTFGQCYADSVGLAIVARLLGKSAEAVLAIGNSRISTLPKWRLKRAIDYIAANLGEQIGLADIAASTGLTRMHFAAQFRAATGLRPHEYLVRRRVERAQELLLTSPLPLAHIALEVGFKAQAHFTTVFARMVGETPGAWRRQHHTGCGVSQG
jgi:AraC family transcriptional regulator